MQISHIYVSPVARSIPYDDLLLPTNLGTDLQTAIDNLYNRSVTSASPGYSYGRSSTVNAGAYLLCETVPSNISGRWVYLNSANITSVYVSNELNTTWKIEVLYHTGNETGLTSLGTVTITSAKGGAFSVMWPVPINTQVAIRVALDTANSPKNVVCGLELSGTRV
jgi:hypothetical protein